MTDRNPFNPGSGLDPLYLAGRDSELESFSHILRLIKAGRVEDMILHGLQSVGKTVLLDRFEQACLKENILPVTRLQYDYSYSDPAVFIKALQYDLNTAAETTRIDHMRKKIKPAAKTLKPKNIEIAGLVSYAPTYDLQADIPLDSQIYNHLAKTWDHIEKNGYEGVIFLFDEFHTVMDIKKNGWFVLAAFIGAMNTLQIKGYKYSLVLSGLPTVVRNVKEARSYSERMFESIQISNLSEADARKAILEPIHNTIWDFSDDLVSAIIRDADMYPYFLQFFASEIIEGSGQKQHLDLVYYETVRAPIMKKLGRSFFAPRMSALSCTQKNVLRSMAMIDQDDISFAEICKASDMGKGPVSNHLMRLEEKGLIHRPERGIYNFSIPLFRKYLLSEL